MPGEAFLVSGGIGGALCLRLAAAGYRPVVGFARSRAAAEAVADRCGGWALPLDLTDPASIDAAVDRLAAGTPDPAVLHLADPERAGSQLAGVVLAGSPPPVLGPIGRITEADMTAQWQVNVLGPQRLLAGLVRQIFRKKRRGTVVGVLSEAMGQGDRPAMASMGAYVIAKHGLAGLLALAAAEYPWLRVTTVSPGFTETGMLRVFDERFLDQMRQRAPFRQPDEVAAEIMARIGQP